MTKGVVNDWLSHFIEEHDGFFFVLKGRRDDVFRRLGEALISWI